MIVKEQAIVEVVEIEKPGQFKNFQIGLPENTVKIIGVETGLKIKSVAASSSGVIVEVADRTRRLFTPPDTDPAFEITKSSIAGTLALQSLNIENVFYRNDVYDFDKNIAYADFSFSGNIKHWTHCRRREELTVNVDGKTPVVEGYYKDLWGRPNILAVKYSVYVCLWIEKSLCNERKPGN